MKKVILSLAAAGLVGGLSIPQESIAITRATCQGTGALYHSRDYRNLFVDYGVGTAADSTQKLQNAYNQLFVNGTNTQKVKFDTSDGMSYILNDKTGETQSASNPNPILQDIRSEGMSYGMMIAVQMNDQATFNRLWNFALTKMLQKQNNVGHHFAWRLYATSPYNVVDTGSAPDGEEYFAMALYFAHNRWGSGVYDTSNEVYTNYIGWFFRVTAMIEKNLFDASRKMVKFSPNSDFTDPSYHLPHFYEIWELRGGSNGTNFFEAASDASRLFFSSATSWNSLGLTSDYAKWDGTRQPTSGSGTTNANAGNFAHDSWRVIHNMAMDHAWCSKSASLKTLILKQLNTFNSAGGGGRKYGDVYTFPSGPWDSTTFHSPGLVAMNAVGVMALDAGNSTEKTLGTGFLQDLWGAAVPSGDWRYYNSMLYMLGMLNVTGNYKIWEWDYEPYWLPSAKMSQYQAPQRLEMQTSVTVQNTTTAALSNFKARYFFAAEEGKTPVLTDISTPNSSPSLVQLDKVIWAVELNYAGRTLQPGQATNGTETFQVRYADNSVFDMANDYSAVGNTSDQVTKRVAVYSSAGAVVMGSEPDNRMPKYEMALKATFGGRVLTSSGSQNDADARAQPLTAAWNTQTWVVEPSAGTALVRIKNKATGKYLNVQALGENGKVVTYALNPTWDSQLWKMETADGGVRFRNVWSDRYLTVRDTSDYSGVFSQALVNGWSSQVWTVYKWKIFILISLLMGKSFHFFYKSFYFFLN